MTLSRSGMCVPPSVSLLIHSCAYSSSWQRAPLPHAAKPCLAPSFLAIQSMNTKCFHFLAQLVKPFYCSLNFHRICAPGALRMHVILCCLSPVSALSAQLRWHGTQVVTWPSHVVSNLSVCRGCQVGARLDTNGSVHVSDLQAAAHAWVVDRPGKQCSKEREGVREEIDGRSVILYGQISSKKTNFSLLPSNKPPSFCVV